jgi:FMN phosphatase YigB (HAD superfamily)
VAPPQTSPPPRPPPQPIRAVLLDLGGVVVRICRSWDEACGHAGIPIRDPERFQHPDLAAARKHLVDLYQTGRIGCNDFWQGIAEATDGLYNAAEIRAVHNAWTLDDYPGVASVVERLSVTPGLITGCLSNTNHAHWVILRDGGPDAGGRFPPSPAIALLHRHLVSHHMRAAKPHEEIYRLAEESLDLPGPSIAFFDDLEENIAAARARGWSAFHIDHNGDTAGQIQTGLRQLGLL